MQRRELFRSAAAAAALAVLPRSVLSAESVWARVIERSSSLQPTAHRALIDALADTIIPRTDTVGALDVNVGAFIDVIVNENYSDEDRAAFMDGLSAIDALAVQTGGNSFANLQAASRERVMAALEQPVDRDASASRTYSRLKGLVVHGYFTSEQVQREVLNTQIVHAAFVGDAPLRTRVRPGGSDA